MNAIAELKGCREELEALSIDRGCDSVSAEDAQRIALAFANCHLESAGRLTFSCPPFSAIRECLASLPDHVFTTYTTFTLHIETLCSRLQDRAWRSNAQGLMDELAAVTSSSIQEHKKTEELLKSTASDLRMLTVQGAELQRLYLDLISFHDVQQESIKAMSDLLQSQLRESSSEVASIQESGYDLRRDIYAISEVGHNLIQNLDSMILATHEATRSFQDAAENTKNVMRTASLELDASVSLHSSLWNTWATPLRAALLSYLLAVLSSRLSLDRVAATTLVGFLAFIGSSTLASAPDFDFTSPRLASRAHVWPLLLLLLFLLSFIPLLLVISTTILPNWRLSGRECEAKAPTPVQHGCLFTASDLQSMSRKELQQLAKRLGICANMKSRDIIHCINCQYELPLQGGGAEALQ